MKRFVVPGMLLACSLLQGGSCHAGTAEREYSIDLWDWTAPCQDLKLFDTWAADMTSIGVTRIEISAPWNRLEPEPGKYDLSYIADRLAIAWQHGLGMRVRINSFYSGATPGWYHGDFEKGIHGDTPSPLPPSINDPRFWKPYDALCTEIARRFRGENIYFNPFIGMHAELKWSGWWSYDAASLKAWRKAIDAKPRPRWLSDVAGSATLPLTPPAPATTHGKPDNSPVSKAWIAFREQSWRKAVKRFVGAIHKGDPDAKISVPLGESFRKESASIANQDYYGLSRGADQVVHSYDFFWHPADEPWMAGAAVASFKGITGIRNICFEFDSPGTMKDHGYTVEKQEALAQEAIEQGAGLKAANYSYDARLPSEWPALRLFGRMTAAAGPPTAPAPTSATVLLFVSKWANYCYREDTQWLHDAQFGAWEMLREKGVPVRVICEDNLLEDLSGYRGLYAAFSPPELMPESRKEQLQELAEKIPSIIELGSVPDEPPGKKDRAPKQAKMNRRKSLVLDYPLAWHWLKGDRAQARALLDKLVQTWRD